MKTKKNSLTASRITEDFKLKTDTLAVSIAEGSQTGEVIRTDWKKVLDKFGHQDTYPKVSNEQNENAVCMD